MTDFEKQQQEAMEREEMRTAAIILARGGSKRIPGKNTINFCGKPLLLWTIEQCKKVKEIASIWVSSDSKEILKLAEKNGCYIITRPHSLSEDDSSSASDWEHAIKVIEQHEGKIDTFIAPQVTSPVREPEDMSEALHIFEKYDHQFMLSYSSGENGSFYIFDNTFQEDNFPKDPKTGKFILQNEKLAVWLIESWKGYEIDWPIDLKICEVLMRQYLLNDRYYESRASGLKYNYYREGYYQDKTDPDGVPRNAQGERERKLEDCKEELSFINNLSPGTILDVGCGYGHMLSGVEDTWYKCGLDLNKTAITHANRFCNSFNGTLQEAQYESDFFDVITLYHVLEHLENPIEDIIEIRRILKPNGKLIIGGPNFECGVAQRFGDNYRLLQDPGHVSLFGPVGLSRLLFDLDFRVDRIKYPFFDTRHFTEENLLRLFDTTKISPPFYGNLATVYSHKEEE